jgi:chemotaxis protein CheX
MLEITNDDISSIVSLVFDATLGITVDNTAKLPPEAETASSLVGITGNWDGAVIVACARPLATRLATAMFGIDESAVGEDDVNDALGELVNMIGGNFKSMLPPVCSLSLPTVVEGRNYRVRVPGAKVVRELDFGASNEHLRVTVVERAA